MFKPIANVEIQDGGVSSARVPFVRPHVGVGIFTSAHAGAHLPHEDPDTRAEYDRHALGPPNTQVHNATLVNSNPIFCSDGTANEEPNRRLWRF